MAMEELSREKCVKQAEVRSVVGIWIHYALLWRPAMAALQEILGFADSPRLYANWRPEARRELRCALALLPLLELPCNLPAPD